LSIVCIYGGSETYPQREELSRGVDLLIATPGRLLDFAERMSVNLSKVIYFVIDEADRMLDMGFIPQVKKIVEELKPRRQT
jgi:ATP-dependent RNA helicase DDX5/DBP2